MLIYVQNKKPLRLATVKQTVFINAPPEKVYNAFLNSKIHSEFTGAKATGGATVGSRITAWDGYIQGKNVKLKKAKLIIQDWRSGDFPKEYGYSSLKLSFKKKGNGTQLTMVHANVPKSKVKDLSSGWKDYYWKPLKKYFGTK